MLSKGSGDAWHDDDEKPSVIKPTDLGSAPSPSNGEARGRPQSPTRWAILLLGIGIIIGPYYSFDNPAGTQVALREYFGVPSQLTPNSTAADHAAFADFNVRYQLLYSLYSLPNTVLPLFCGALVDALGTRVMVIASALVAFGGHVLVVGGVQAQSWAAMWAGRAIFGIGTEAQCVATRILIAQWFMGRELALSMGVILAFGRFGSVINDNISALFDYRHVVGAYCVGATMCALSVAAAVAAVALDRGFDARGSAAQSEEGGASPKGQWGGDSSRSASFDGDERGGGGGTAPLLAHDSLHDEDHAASGDSSPGSGIADGGSDAPAPVVKRNMLTDIASFGPAYWVLAPVCVVGFPCITSFNGVASAFLSQRWAEEGAPHDTARVNAVMGILYTVAACLALFIGALIDRAGRRAVFMAGAMVFVCVTHLLFAVTSAPAEALLVLLGLCFAVYAAAFWPSIAYVTPPGTLGTAYGLMGSVQNAGLAVIPLVIGLIQPPACGGRYSCVEFMFVAMSSSGAALCVVAGRLERRVTQQQAKALQGEAESDDASTAPVAGGDDDTAGTTPGGSLWGSLQDAARGAMRSLTRLAGGDGAGPAGEEGGSGGGDAKGRKYQQLQMGPVSSPASSPKRGTSG